MTKFQYPGSSASTFASIAALPVSAFRAAKPGPQNGNSEHEQRSQTHTTPSTLSDPGTQQALLVKGQILKLQVLLAGNGAGGGEPNQDSHDDSEQDSDDISGKRGAVDVRSALQVSKGLLDSQKPFSADLIKVIDACLPVCDVV